MPADPISATTIKPIIDLVEKASPRVAVTVFIVSGILFIVPRLTPGTFPWMDSLATEHATFLGIALLFSGVLTVTFAVTGISSALTKKRERRILALAEVKLEKDKQKAEADRIAKLHARLNALATTEKHFLQEFIEGDTRIIQCNATLGRLDALCASGILRVTQMYGVKGTYMISDESWDYLSNHRDLIATPDKPRPQRTFYSEY